MIFNSGRSDGTAQGEPGTSTLLRGLVQTFIPAFRSSALARALLVGPAFNAAVDETLSQLRRALPDAAELDGAEATQALQYLLSRSHWDEILARLASSRLRRDSFVRIHTSRRARAFKGNRLCLIKDAHHGFRVDPKSGVSDDRK